MLALSSKHGRREEFFFFYRTFGKSYGTIAPLRVAGISGNVNGRRRRRLE